MNFGSINTLHDDQSTIKMITYSLNIRNIQHIRRLTSQDTRSHIFKRSSPIRVTQQDYYMSQITRIDMLIGGGVGSRE